MKNNDIIIYKGMNENQIAELYDDTLSIPDLYALLQKNREHAKAVQAKLNPIVDIAYGSEPIQKLDIYAPLHAKDLPVLIDIHGGGWVAGSKNARSIPAEVIMSQGVIWVPIDYGLAPQYKMQDIITHVRSALAWIYKHISEFGGDPNRIYVSGQSAGAHLAATTLMAGWHENLKVPENLVKGLIALSGVYDFGSLIQFPNNETQEILKLTSDEARRFSPIYHPLKKTIPSIIAYGDKESFAYSFESKEYAKHLEQAGCDVSLIVVPNANHFDMINELSSGEGEVFVASMKMISYNVHP